MTYIRSLVSKCAESTCDDLAEAGEYDFKNLAKEIKATFGAEVQGDNRDEDRCPTQPQRCNLETGRPQPHTI